MSSAIATGPELLGEHEFEAAEGLPEALPEGERVLWQGAPALGALAVSCFHVRAATMYFVVLLALRAGYVVADGGTALAALGALPGLAALAVAAIGLLVAFAWLTARTTLYTVTDRRVVMRIGIVLTVTFNLPFSRITAASVARRADGSGDIALALDGRDRIAIVHLWPHARPWRLVRPEPSLRCIGGVDAVGATLAAAWQAAHATTTAIDGAKAAPKAASWLPGARPAFARAVRRDAAPAATVAA